MSFYMSTAEEILSKYKPIGEYPNYYHESDVLAAMEEYASQSPSTDNLLSENDVEAMAWAMLKEDAKGFKTVTYKKKKKLMKSVYGIEVKEV